MAPLQQGVGLLWCSWEPNRFSSREFYSRLRLSASSTCLPCRRVHGAVISDEWRPQFAAATWPSRSPTNGGCGSSATDRSCGEHSAVVWNSLKRGPSEARLSAAGDGVLPPNVLNW